MVQTAVSEVNVNLSIFAWVWFVYVVKNVW